MLEIDRIGLDTLSLCEIGNRFAGTPGEREARRFIRRRFEDLGLSSVREEPFEVATYRPQVSRCALLGISSEPGLLCVGLQFTASGAVESEAVALGELNSEADLEAAVAAAGGVSGRIAVLGTSYPYLFSEALVARGAVGLVVTSDAPDGHVCHLNALMYPALAGRPNGTLLPVPGVTVERSDAARLLEHIAPGGGERRGGRIRIDHQASYETVVTANVVGVLEGAGSAEAVVLGGHYDSQLAGVGASDNASGIASLLEAARVMADSRPFRSVVFAAFADEEGGLRGATDYCRRHAASLDRTVGMVNIDAPGWAPSQRSLHADPALRAFAIESAGQLGWVPDEDLEASLFPGSDHNPFIDAGVPACFFWRHPPRHPYYHTAGDEPGLLDFAVITETASVAQATVERLATIEALQLGRARPSKRWLDLRPESKTKDGHQTPGPASLEEAGYE